MKVGWLGYFYFHKQEINYHQFLALFLDENKNKQFWCVIYMLRCSWAGVQSSHMTDVIRLSFEKNMTHVWNYTMY